MARRRGGRVRFTPSSGRLTSESRLNYTRCSVASGLYGRLAAARDGYTAQLAGMTVVRAVSRAPPGRRGARGQRLKIFLRPPTPAFYSARKKIRAECVLILVSTFFYRFRFGRGVCVFFFTFFSLFFFFFPFCLGTHGFIARKLDGLIGHWSRAAAVRWNF